MTHIHKPQLTLETSYKACTSCVLHQLCGAMGMLSISVYIFCFIVSKLVTSAYLSLSAMYAEYVSK